MIDVDIRARGFAATARAIDALANITGKSVEELATAHAKGVLTRTVRYTPPQSTNVKGPAAKKQLDGRILADIHGIFHQVAAKSLQRVDQRRVKRGAAVTSVFKSRWMRKRSSAWRRTGIPPASRYYAGVTDINRLAREQKGKVGKLGSGWLRAAEKLNVTMPAWMRRHGSGSGTFRSRAVSGRIEIRMVNNRRGASGHLTRIIQSAEKNQLNATKRQTQFLIRKLSSDLRLIGRAA